MSKGGCFLGSHSQCAPWLKGPNAQTLCHTLHPPSPSLPNMLPHTRIVIPSHLHILDHSVCYSSSTPYSCCCLIIHFSDPYSTVKSSSSIFFFFFSFSLWRLPKQISSLPKFWQLSSIPPCWTHWMYNRGGLSYSQSCLYIPVPSLYSSDGRFDWLAAFSSESLTLVGTLASLGALTMTGTEFSPPMTSLSCPGCSLDAGTLKPPEQVLTCGPG